MKILIAADMEGITGVVHWEQVNPNHMEYQRFRKLMTEDVNAAVQGAADGGADEITVTDGHSHGRNILIDQLDPRAVLNCGTPAMLSMVQGIDKDVAGVLLIGYHARIGTPQAILEHTWSDERVSNFSLRSANDSDFHAYGEIGLNAAVCGHFNVPVIMISGDQSSCTEATDLLGQIETAVIKYANGRMAAECLPPEESHRRIRQAAFQAVNHLIVSEDHGELPNPLILQPPITLAIDFVQSEMADKAAIMPGATRMGRRIEYTAMDMVTIYRGFRTLINLAR